MKGVETRAGLKVVRLYMRELCRLAWRVFRNLIAVFTGRHTCRFGGQSIQAYRNRW